MNIPTALSKAETHLLRQVARNRLVVEAGALLGYSTFNLATTALRVETVDRFEGYGTPTYNRFMSNLDIYGKGKVVARKGDLPRMKGEMAFLDLTGEEKLTSLAMATIHSSVHLLLVHDLCRFNCRGVERAIHSQRKWKLVEAVDTIGVLVCSKDE